MRSTAPAARTSSSSARRWLIGSITGSLPCLTLATAKGVLARTQHLQLLAHHFRMDLSLDVRRAGFARGLVDQRDRVQPLDAEMRAGQPLEGVVGAINRRLERGAELPGHALRRDHVRGLERRCGGGGSSLIIATARLALPHASAATAHAASTRGLIVD
jgi:hypothetical protein